MLWKKNVIYLDFYLTLTKSMHMKWYDAWMLMLIAIFSFLNINCYKRIGFSRQQIWWSASCLFPNRSNETIMIWIKSAYNFIAGYLRNKRIHWPREYNVLPILNWKNRNKIRQKKSLCEIPNVSYCQSCVYYKTWKTFQCIEFIWCRFSNNI